MNNDLYTCYDGPLPRQKNRTTGSACWKRMLREYLRAIRLKRRAGDWDGLSDLTTQVRFIRNQLVRKTPCKRLYLCRIVR